MKHNRKYYIIYQTTNLVNNKIYIGKHKTDNLDDGYIGSGILLWSAIEKYGIENFEKEILFFCENEELLNLKEAELVTPEFIARDDTYNLALGGQGGWSILNYSISKEERSARSKKGWIKFKNSDSYEQKIKDKANRAKEYYKTHIHPQKGKKIPESQRINQIIGKKIYYKTHNGPTTGTMHVHDIETNQNLLIPKVNKTALPKNLEPGWITNYKMPDDTKKKISLKMSGKNNPMHGKKLKDYMSEEKYNEWLEKQKSKVHNSTTGKISIFKGSITKFIDPVKLDIFIKDGWQKGIADYNKDKRERKILILRPMYKLYIENNYNWQYILDNYDNQFTKSRRKFIDYCRWLLPEYVQIFKNRTGIKRGPYKRK